MKLRLKILLGCIAGIMGLYFSVLLLRNFAAKAYYKGGDVTRDLSELIRIQLAQARYIEAPSAEWVGVDYIDTALEISIHNMNNAAKIIKYPTLDRALNTHLEAYLRFYRSSIVTGNGDGKVIIGKKKGNTLRIFRGSELDTNFSEGDSGADAIRHMIESLRSRLAKDTAPLK